MIPSSPCPYRYPCSSSLPVAQSGRLQVPPSTKPATYLLWGAFKEKTYESEFIQKTYFGTHPTPNFLPDVQCSEPRERPAESDSSRSCLAQSQPELNEGIMVVTSLCFPAECYNGTPMEPGWLGLRKPAWLQENGPDLSPENPFMQYHSRK